LRSNACGLYLGEVWFQCWPGNGYTVWDFSWISSLSTKFPDSTLKYIMVASFHILSNSLIGNHSALYNLSHSEHQAISGPSELNYIGKTSNLET
jgi:hypothetical protein